MAKALSGADRRGDGWGAGLRQRRQLGVVAALAVSSALCVGLLGARFVYTQSLAYRYLGWNLFLAWLPLLCSLAAYNAHKPRAGLSWLVVAGCGAAWLLFFPNAPYLLTDIAHLRRGDGMLFWYDLLMLVAFAWTGCLLGLVSLWLMHSLARRTAGAVAGWLFALGALGLSGFGIYLGRFLRWNSWDAVLRPAGVLADLAAPLRQPLDYWPALAFSALFSLFLAAAYVSLVAVMQLRNS